MTNIPKTARECCQEHDALCMHIRWLVEALEECRFRLAANQPVTGVHPNDVRAFDLSDRALISARANFGWLKQLPVSEN